MKGKLIKKILMDMAEWLDESENVWQNMYQPAVQGLKAVGELHNLFK